jgi:hypothetical protein
VKDVLKTNQISLLIMVGVCLIYLQVNHGMISENGNIFRLGRTKKMELRTAALELSQIEIELEAKNTEVYALRQRRNEKSEQVKQILSNPQYNTVNLLALPNGKEIKIMREFNKPWSITQGMLHEIITLYFREQNLPDSARLIAAINLAIRTRNHSTDMKIEFK